MPLHASAIARVCGVAGFLLSVLVCLSRCPCSLFRFVRWWLVVGGWLLLGCLVVFGRRAVLLVPVATAPDEEPGLVTKRLGVEKKHQKPSCESEALHFLLAPPCFGYRESVWRCRVFCCRSWFVCLVVRVRCFVSFVGGWRWVGGLRLAVGDFWASCTAPDE